MSVFGSIVSAIFGSKHAAGVTPAATPSSSAPSSTGATPTSSAPPSPSAGATASSATPAAAAAAKPISRADVEAILHKLAADVREDLDWKRSIVDLMKLLKLDSGLGRPQATGAGARLYRRPRWLGGHEHLAAQASDDEACRERRQGSGQSQGLTLTHDA